MDSPSKLASLFMKREGIQSMIQRLSDELGNINEEIKEIEKTYGEITNEDRFYKYNGYKIGFVFMEHFTEIDRYVIGKIENSDGWVTIVDNYGEAYNIKIEGNSLLVTSNNTGHLIIHEDLFKRGKEYYVSMKTDDLPRRKLRGYEIDLVRLYCKHTRYQLNSRQHHDFKKFLNSFQLKE